MSDVPTAICDAPARNLGWRSGGRHRARRSWGLIWHPVSRALVICAAIILPLAHCASDTTTASQPSRSGFLDDYTGLSAHPTIASAELSRRASGLSDMRPRVLLDEPVMMIGRNSDAGALNLAALSVLTDYLRNSMLAALGDDYELAEAPGPGVLRVRTAITRITAIEMNPRTVPLWGSGATYVHAKLRAGASASRPLIETALEAEIVDAATGERLVGFTDRRIGGEQRPRSGAPAWTQVTAALDFWANELRRELDRTNIR